MPVVYHIVELASRIQVRIPFVCHYIVSMTMITRSNTRNRTSGLISATKINEEGCRSLDAVNIECALFVLPQRLLTAHDPASIAAQKQREAFDSLSNYWWSYHTVLADCGSYENLSVFRPAETQLTEKLGFQIVHQRDQRDLGYAHRRWGTSLTADTERLCVKLAYVDRYCC